MGDLKYRRTTLVAPGQESKNVTGLRFPAMVESARRGRKEG